MQYQETRGTLLSIISERNSIRSEQLDKLGPKMQLDYENVLDAIVDRQNRLGPAGAATAERTLWLILAVALAAMAVGAGLALIIAKSVTGSVRRMAADMNALANDDLEVEIRGAEQMHVLGLMAQALTVLKENALKVRQLAADKAEAEADAATAEARTRMMLELQREFGAVVASAVAGDFSGRITAQFPDAELNDLADAVNQLLATVETGVSETGRVWRKSPPAISTTV